MDKDLESDFRKWESRLRGHSVRLKPGRSPFDSEGTHKLMQWKEIDGGFIYGHNDKCIGVIKVI